MTSASPKAIRPRSTTTPPEDGATTRSSNNAGRSRRQLPKVLPGSWFLLAGGSGAVGTPSLPGLVAAISRRRGDAALARCLRLERQDHAPRSRTRPSNLASFDLRDDVGTGAERGTQARREAADLPALRQHARAGTPRRHIWRRNQPLAVSGKRQRLRVVTDDRRSKFKPDGAVEVAVKPGDSFTLRGRADVAGLRQRNRPAAGRRSTTCCAGSRSSCCAGG